MSKVVIIGGGAAGMAAAIGAAECGHDVSVYEKNEKLGGMVVYGIPSFVLEKDIVAADRHETVGELHDKSGCTEAEDVFRVSGTFRDLILMKEPQLQLGFFHEEKQDEGGGQALGDHGGQCHTGHVHAEQDYEDQIQDDIQYTCSRQKVKRPFGITHGTQNGTSEVISHIGWHTDENNGQIKGCFFDHIIRGSRP